MSDSEEDFASADEGETEAGQRSRKTSSRSKKSSSGSTSEPAPAATSNEKPTDEVTAPLEVDSVSGKIDVVLNEPESQDILDEKDHTREVTPTRNVERQNESESVEESEPVSTDGGWTSSFGSWGSALLSTASKSVSTFTHSVEDGFHTVIETVEATLAVPTPEEMAARQAADAAKEQDAVDDENKEVEEKKAEDEQESAAGRTVGNWLSWGAEGFSNITHKVQDTSKTLVHGSLDVLEAIGKKTVDALKEGDPGLQKTKTIINPKGNKPVLSEVLRDAKENAEKNAEAEREFEESRKANFSAQFDEAQGLVHLEALEMLSNESESKVQSLLSTMSADTLEKLKTELIQIKEHFEIDELDDEEETNDHDFVQLITSYLTDLHIDASPAKILKAQSDGREQIDSCSSKTDGKDIHQHAIQSLALITSRSVEQFHKAGELILLRKDPMTDFKVRAKTISELTKVMCSEVGILSTKYTEILNTIIENAEDKDSINQFITNVYLEATNSSTYIQDAFQLLLPVLQLAAIENQMEN